MSKKTYVNKFDLQTEDHLVRYLKNREKRTGQKWKVVERYHTDGMRADERSYSCGWNRALIRAEDGSSLRIYHTGRCWQMAQGPNTTTHNPRIKLTNYGGMSKMTEKEKALAKEMLRLLKAVNIKIREYEDYDNEESYVGTRYYIRRGDVAVSIERLFDAQNLVREV